ncbi:MAG: VOC family protein [Chloroflexi bacterium]|nr:VOC family protein [Chloroflexota bacterium]
MSGKLRLYQTSFTVSDFDRSIAFYRDVLGMTVKRTFLKDGETLGVMTGYPGTQLRIAMLAAGDHEIELLHYIPAAGKKQPPERRDIGAGHIAFQVDDIEAVYKDLKAKGVRFVSPPQDFGAAKACYFTDPDGITLELVQRMPG